ncbi:MAG: hypothetical protein EBR30_07405 [Cytophagia bacterium]|nr:hypothetical protein [Cytophagia bacterium]
MDPLTIMLISSGIQAGVGAYRNIKASKGLAALQKERMPRYMDAAAPIQENKQMYSQMARTGMGPASLALARNQFAAGQNALSAAPASGQLRTQIGRMASANAGGFANQLAAQNEAIRRQAMGGVAQANLGLSGLQQRDVATDVQRRMQTEQAYGQAIQQSRQDMMGAATGLATGMLGMQNAEANRQMYRDIYGVKQPQLQTPGQLPYSPLIRGAFPQPEPTSTLTLEDMYGLPKNMGGFGDYRIPATAGLPIDYSKLPYEMGGTGGLRPSYAMPQFGLSEMSQLPATMGGYGGLGKKFTTPKSYIK